MSISVTRGTAVEKIPALLRFPRVRLWQFQRRRFNSGSSNNFRAFGKRQHRFPSTPVTPNSGFGNARTINTGAALGRHQHRRVRRREPRYRILQRRDPTDPQLELRQRRHRQLRPAERPIRQFGLRRHQHHVGRRGGNSGVLNSGYGNAGSCNAATQNAGFCSAGIDTSGLMISETNSAGISVSGNGISGIFEVFR